MNDKNTKCLGRERFSINGKTECCKVQVSDEIEIAQGVVDSIDDYLTPESMLTVCSRISYATAVIHKGWSADVDQTMMLFKRFSVLVYEYRNRILEDDNRMKLYLSFTNIVKKWFMVAILHDNHTYLPENYLDSINADLQTLEMALGVCVLPELEESDLDDLFF